MSTGIRRIRRKMDPYQSDFNSINGNDGRFPRSGRIGGCCDDEKTLRVDDINCALIKQAVALNDIEQRLECKADKKCCDKKKKKCCEKKKKCCEKKKKCCDKKKKCCKVLKCCEEKKCCSKPVCCQQRDPCNPCNPCEPRCTKITVCCPSSSSSSCCSSSSSSSCSSSSCSSSSCSSSSEYPPEVLEVFGYQGLGKVVLNPDGTMSTIVEERIGKDANDVVTGLVATAAEVEDFMLQTEDEWFINGVRVNENISPQDAFTESTAALNSGLGTNPGPGSGTGIGLTGLNRTNGLNGLARIGTGAARLGSFGTGRSIGAGRIMSAGAANARTAPFGARQSAIPVRSVFQNGRCQVEVLEPERE